jgi:N-acetylneuraminic acid mutarotase
MRSGSNNMRKNIAFLLVFALLVSIIICVELTFLPPVNAQENTWLSKAPMHHSRYNFGIAVVNEKVYALGGSTGSVSGNAFPLDVLFHGATDINEEYDPARNIWTDKKSMPTARILFGTAVYQDKIYCIGGYYTINSTYYRSVSNEVYDPVTDTWETCSDMPVFDSENASIVTASVVAGKIYVTDRNITQAYDPKMDSWTAKAPPPCSIVSRTSIVINQKIYLLGAQIDSSGYGTGKAVVLCYDPFSNSWRAGGEAPTKGLGAMSALTTADGVGRIYFFDADRTDIYYPENETWGLGPPMPTPRYLARGTFVSNVFYVIGGLSGDYGYIVLLDSDTTNEKYVPLEANSLINSNPTPSPPNFGPTSPPTPSPTQLPTINTGAEPPQTEPFPTAQAVFGTVIVIAAGMILLGYFKKRIQRKNTL